MRGSAGTAAAQGRVESGFAVVEERPNRGTFTARGLVGRDPRALCTAPQTGLHRREKRWVPNLAMIFVMDAAAPVRGRLAGTGAFTIVCKWNKIIRLCEVSFRRPVQEERHRHSCGGHQGFTHRHHAPRTARGDRLISP